MNHTADAKQFCHHLWHQYLEERSYEIPGGYFSPQLSVIGTGKHEVSHSLQEFAVLLEREENSGTAPLSSSRKHTRPDS